MKTNSPFQIQIASDIQRDGLGAELISGGTVVAEVFRCDADNTVVVTTFGRDIPIVEFEEFLSQARSKLGKFEDGTELPRKD